MMTGVLPLDKYSNRPTVARGALEMRFIGGMLWNRL